jgi:hypothetical protein
MLANRAWTPTIYGETASFAITRLAHEEPGRNGPIRRQLGCKLLSVGHKAVIHIPLGGRLHFIPRKLYNSISLRRRVNLSDRMPGSVSKQFNKRTRTV